MIKTRWWNRWRLQQVNAIHVIWLFKLVFWSNFFQLKTLNSNKNVKIDECNKKFNLFCQFVVDKTKQNGNFFSADVDKSKTGFVNFSTQIDCHNIVRIVLFSCRLDAFIRSLITSFKKKIIINIDQMYRYNLFSIFSVSKNVTRGNRRRESNSNHIYYLKKRMIYYQNGNTHKTNIMNNKWWKN